MDDSEAVDGMVRRPPFLSGFEQWQAQFCSASPWSCPSRNARHAWQPSDIIS